MKTPSILKSDILHRRQSKNLFKGSKNILQNKVHKVQSLIDLTVFPHSSKIHQNPHTSLMSQKLIKSNFIRVKTFPEKSLVHLYNKFHSAAVIIKHRKSERVKKLIIFNEI